MRRIIAGALTPRALADTEPGLRSLVDRLLDEMSGKAQVDLIEDFSAAIPVEVIGNLLDIPHADRGPLRGWSLAILGALEPAIPAEVLDRGNRAVSDFADYLRRLVEDRRANPGDPQKDVLTRLIGEESDGSRRNATELLQNCIWAPPNTPGQI